MATAFLTNCTQIIHPSDSPSEAPGSTASHLHQARVLVGGQAVDVVLALGALHLEEGGEALLYVVRAGDLLLPVAHVDLQHL